MYRRLSALSMGLILFSLALHATQNSGKASIEGTVTNLAGGPLRGARISVSRVDPDSGPGVSIASVSTDGTGHYLITGLAPGEYRISAERDGFIHQEYSRGAPISIGTAAMRRADFQLSPAGVITGRVLDDIGEPLVGAIVQAQAYQFINGKMTLMPVPGQSSQPGTYTPPAQASTNDLGEYRLFWLPPGEYFINVKARPRIATPATIDAAAPRVDRTVFGGIVDHPLPEPLAPIYFPGVLDAAAASPVKVTASAEIKGIDFNWKPVALPSIRGQIVLPAAPEAQNSGRRFAGSSRGGTIVLTRVGGGRVQVSGQAGSSQAGPSGNLELFEIRGVPPGFYYVNALLRQDTSTYFARIRVEIADTDVNGVVATAQSTRDVRGQLILESGSMPNFPMSAVHVGVSPVDEIGLGTWNSAVAEDGTFILRNMAPVEYRLSVSGLPDGAYIVSAKIGATDVLTNPFVLEAEQGLQVQIGFAAGRLTGTIVDGTGRSSSGATVTLVPDEPRRARADLHFTAVSDLSGRFNVRNIPPGDYRAYAWDHIPSGAAQSLDFMRPFENLGTPLRIGNNSVADIRLSLISN
jgi:protocatechuate 3,4-dioxygenase beta subunit